MSFRWPSMTLGELLGFPNGGVSSCSLRLKLLLSAGISPDRIHVFADPGQFEQYVESLKDLNVQVIKGEHGISNQRRLGFHASLFLFDAFRMLEPICFPVPC